MIYQYHNPNASIFFLSTIVPEANITIVSKPYHELKFNHHNLYDNPHACIYLDHEKMHQMQKQDR